MIYIEQVTNPTLNVMGGGGGGWGWTKSWYNFSKQPFLTVALGDFNVNSNRWCKSEKHHKKAQKLRA